MIIDLVHDMQSIFRKIVNLNSFPGNILNLKVESDKIPSQLDFHKGVLLLSLTLFDGEVTFYCTDKELSQIISGYTYSKQSGLKSANFIIHTPTDNISDLIDGASKGTLSDPHLGATIFVQVDEISKDNPNLKLQGPGIKDQSQISITSGFNFTKSREKANNEFPIGVDMILVDKNGNFTALPRTTIIEEIL